MKETELKPCPFCGSIASIGRTKKTLTHQFSAHCANSRCIANRLSNPFVMHYLSRDEAAEAWNRRVDNEQREAD
jgi:hypothetical protein